MRSVRLYLIALLAFALPLGAAAARAPRERVVEAPYKTPVLGVAAEGNKGYYFDCPNGIGCAILRLQKGDRFASIRIEDTLGLPVRGDIYLMPGNIFVGDLCGETENPFAVAYAAEILVHVQSGTCAGPSPSIGTTGKVVATITTRR